MAEYCASSPFDNGCELLMPVFYRAFGEDSMLELHVADIFPTAEVTTGLRKVVFSA